MKVRKEEPSSPNPGRIGLVKETALDDPKCREENLLFTKEQLEKYDYSVTRNLAAYVPSDAVNGKSTNLEVTDFFAVQHSLSEYE